MRFELVADQSQVWIDGNSSVHPVRATTAGLDGWVEIDGRNGALRAGEVAIPVDRLQSGNPLVDRETRRRIDSRRFPTIHGELLEVLARSTTTSSVRGRIDFRGESVEVTGDLDVARDGDDLRVTGRKVFDVRDWGLQPPRLLMLKVHPEIEVRIDLRARRVG